VLVEPPVGGFDGREYLHPSRIADSSLCSAIEVVEIDPGSPPRSPQLGSMLDGSIDLLSVSTILSVQRHHAVVDIGGKPRSLAGRVVGPLDSAVECIRHGHLLFTRNGFSIVNTSGLIPRSMRAQLTGAAIGKRSRAPGSACPKGASALSPASEACRSFARRGKALEWVLLGSHVTAQEALAHRLLTSMHAAADLMPAAMELVRKFRSLGARTVAQSKMTVRMCGDADLSSDRASRRSPC
jgi:hypothetical protein